MTAVNLNVRYERPYAQVESQSRCVSPNRLFFIPTLPSLTEWTTNAASGDLCTRAVGSLLQLPSPTGAGIEVLRTLRKLTDRASIFGRITI